MSIINLSSQMIILYSYTHTCIAIPALLYGILKLKSLITMHSYSYCTCIEQIEALLILLFTYCCDQHANLLLKISLIFKLVLIIVIMNLLLVNSFITSLIQSTYFLDNLWMIR